METDIRGSVSLPKVKRPLWDAEKIHKGLTSEADPDLKACPQRSGKKGERRGVSHSPKAGTALLSRPARTMFTVKSRKRVQGRVALGT